MTDLPELPAAADERRPDGVREGWDVRAHAQHAPRRDRPALSLRLDRRCGLGDDGVSHEAMRRLADQ